MSLGSQLNRVRNASASHHIGSFMFSLKTCLCAVYFFSLSFLQSWCNPGTLGQDVGMSFGVVVPELHSLHSTVDPFEQFQEKNNSI